MSLPPEVLARVRALVAQPIVPVGNTKKGRAGLRDSEDGFRSVVIRCPCGGTRGVGTHKVVCRRCGAPHGGIVAPRGW